MTAEDGGGSEGNGNGDHSADPVLSRNSPPTPFAFKSRPFREALMHKNNRLDVPTAFPFPPRPCPRCCGGQEARTKNYRSFVGRQLTNTLNLPITSVVSGLRVSGRNSGLWFGDLRFAFRNRCGSFDYPPISRHVAKSERVKTALEKQLEPLQSNDGERRKRHKQGVKKIRNILKTMQATISTLVIRVTGWFLFKVLRKFMVGVYVSELQIEELRNTAGSNSPIIYLPVHRSHLDYVLLTWTLWQYDIRVPYVASGDNLNFSGFGWLLKSLGGFFIRRRLDGPALGDGSPPPKDTLYRAVLHSYMEQILMAGESLEFFIEGSRSRTGKSLLPKSGLMSVVIDTYLEGKIEDALLVPVSYSYEKVLDIGFVEELIGAKKERESLWGVAVSVFRALGQQYGAVRVDFGLPISLKEMTKSMIEGGVLENYSIINQSDSTNVLCPLTPSPAVQAAFSTQHRRNLVEAVSHHILYDATQNAALTGSQLLSALFWGKYEEGGLLSDLAADFMWLISELNSRGKEVIGFPTTNVSSPFFLEISPIDLACQRILYAAQLMGDSLVKIQPDEGQMATRLPGFSSKLAADSKCTSYKDMVLIPNFPDERSKHYLAYYRNGAITPLLPELLIATAYLSFPQNADISEKDILERSLVLGDLIKGEFLLKRPCESLEESLRDVLRLRFLRGKSGIFKPSLGNSVIRTYSGEAARIEIGMEEDSGTSERSTGDNSAKLIGSDSIENIEEEISVALQMKTKSGGFKRIDPSSQIVLRGNTVLKVTKQEMDMPEQVLQFYKKLGKSFFQSLDSDTLPQWLEY